MSDAVTIAAPPAPARQPLTALLSDARLTRLAADGSTAAFSAIYRRHHQQLYRYCRSILGNDEEAADALQETMAKAMRALEGERREITLKPWLFRIAHNEAITILRRRRPEQPLEHASSIASADAGPEVRQELRDLIADLDRLTPRQRGALVMRELSGLGFDEIAVALETSPAAVKTSVYEARLALHEFEAGREMTCDDVRHRVSDGDGRVLRGRAIRAHLATCGDCERFAREPGERSRLLGAIAPPLPAPAAAAILGHILDGGGPAGIAAVVGGGAAGAAGIGAGAALKLGVAGVLAVGVGAAALELDRGGDRSAPGTPTRQSAKPESAHPAAAPAAAGAPVSSARSGADRGPAASDDRHPGGQSANGGSKHGDGAGSANGGSGAAPPVETAPTSAPVEPSASTPAADTGPTGTPPGHGGTPPGQGGTPPGLGQPPPGHGGTPPGPAGTPPGQVAPPPGQAGTTPGQSGTPPGQSGAAPGLSTQSGPKPPK